MKYPSNSSFLSISFELFAWSGKNAIFKGLSPTLHLHIPLLYQRNCIRSNATSIVIRKQSAQRIFLVFTKIGFLSNRLFGIVCKPKTWRVKEEEDDERKTCSNDRWPFTSMILFYRPFCLSGYRIYFVFFAPEQNGNLYIEHHNGKNGFCLRSISATTTQKKTEQNRTKQSRMRWQRQKKSVQLPFDCYN